MVLIRVAFLVITVLPFVIERIYIYNRIIDSINSLQLAIEQLVFGITSSIFHINSAVNMHNFFNTIICILNLFLGSILCVFVSFKTISSTSQTCIWENYLSKINFYDEKIQYWS